MLELKPVGISLTELVNWSLHNIFNDFTWRKKRDVGCDLKHSFLDEHSFLDVFLTADKEQFIITQISSKQPF